MKLVILGATGATGKQLVSLALASGHEVTAVARNPSAIAMQDAKLEVAQGEATQAQSLEKILPGHEAVLSCIGSASRKANTVRSDTARAVIAAAKKSGIRRVVWLSAMGVGDSADQARRSSFVFGRIIMPLFLSEVYADSALAEALLRDSGLDWVVTRPAELTNAPGTGHYDLVPLHEKAPRLKISRADVARMMLDQLTTDAHLHKCVSIC